MNSNLMSSQKINDLLQMASNYAECDEECQKNKKTQDLYKKYLDSQAIVENGPKELEKNKKNYYVYTNGETYYENMKQTELNKNVNDIISQITEEFNLQIELAKSLNTVLATTDPEVNCTDQYPIIQGKLKHEIYEKTDEMMVNNRETYYDDQATENLELWKKFLLFIYYFLILVFLILCFPKTLYQLFKY